jgi:lantibiotic modifying enzyme
VGQRRTALAHLNIMNVVETILESWVSDRSADLADEACRMGIADSVELQHSFTRWLVNDLSFLVGDALTAAQRGLAEAHGPITAEALLMDEAAAGPTCDLLTQVFPAAASLFRDRVDASVRAIQELLKRFAADNDGLQALDCHGPISSITVGLGDSHDDARQVALVETSFGSRVLYKPRSHRADVAWNRLARTLNGLASRTLIDTVSVIDRGSYGWQEYCPALSSPEFTDERGEQMGATLAVLHRLGSTDMHRDNLVFTKDGPVVLDTETIASWPISRLIPGDPETTVDSVLETSAVASWTVDLDGQWTSIAPIHDLVHIGDPDCAETNRRIEVICAGYRLGNALLASAAAAAPVADVASSEARLIVRRTSVYARLLQESVLPQSLRSERARSSSIAKLEPWPADLDAVVDAIVSDERECLTRGDIPRFISTAAGEIRSPRRIVGNLACDGPRKVRQPADGIRQAERQTRVLSASLRPLAEHNASGSSDIALTEAARRLKEDLLTRIVEVDGRTTVIGGVLDPLKFAAGVGPLGHGIYGGRSGVSVALAAASLQPERSNDRNIAISLLPGTNSHTGDQRGLTGPTSDFYARLIVASRDGVDASPNWSLASSAKTLDVVDGLAGESMLNLAIGALDADMARSALARFNDRWTDADTSDLGALGIAHGASGIAFAAVRLARTLQDDALLDRWLGRFHTSSRAVVAASIQAKNHESVSWCRGVAGIVSTQLHLADNGLASAELPSWIEWLFENHALAVGNALCCGAGSIADIIATLRHLGHPEPSQAEMALKYWFSQPQNPRLPATQPHIGFMQGTAGVIYTMIRLTDAGRSLPSVLSFDQVV